MTKLVIIGSGGFGREVHDVVDAIVARNGDIDLLGFVDDKPNAINQKLVEQRGSRVLGPLSWFDTIAEEISYVIGIGNPQVCARIDREMSRRSLPAFTLVHPEASLGWNIRLFPGVIVCAGARLSTNITVGRHVHVDRNCLIGHDSHIGDYTVMFPGATVAGSVQVGQSSLLGSNSTTLQSLRIGQGAVLGAGAVLTRDIPAEATAVGVPARWSLRG